MAELDAERVGAAIVLRQLAAVIGLDAVARELQRIERGAASQAAVAASSSAGVTRRPIAPRSTRSNFLGQLDQRRVAARHHVRDDARAPPARRRPRLRAWRRGTRGSARENRRHGRRGGSAWRRPADRSQRHRCMACGNLPRQPRQAWSTTCSGRAAAVQVGPRSASSHSRHSTSRRSAAPPEKIRVTAPAGRVGLVEFDRQQVQHRVLGGRAHIAAAEGVHALEAQRGAAPLVAGVFARRRPPSRTG